MYVLYILTSRCQYLLEIHTYCNIQCMSLLDPPPSYRYRWLRAMRGNPFRTELGLGTGTLNQDYSLPTLSAALPVTPHS
jgi:DNA-binding PadR family transcriptional regulator